MLMEGIIDLFVTLLHDLKGGLVINITPDIIKTQQEMSVFPFNLTLEKMHKTLHSINILILIYCCVSPEFYEERIINKMYYYYLHLL